MRLIIFLIFMWSLSNTALARQGSRLLKGEALSKKAVSSKCIPLGPKDSDCNLANCTVKEVEKFGAVPGKNLMVAFYDYHSSRAPDSKICASGLVVLEQSGAGPKFLPVWGDFVDLSLGEIEYPKIVQSPQGSLVLIPVRFGGTAHDHADGVILLRDGKFHEVDAESYQAELKKRLAPTLSLNKGLYPDFKTMTLESATWKKDDPNCCPTGGSIKVGLGLEHDTLVVKTFAHEINHTAKP